MRIDLHSHGQKFCLLLLDLNLLVDDTVLVDRLDKLSVTTDQVVITFRQLTDLVVTLDILYFLQSDLIFLSRVKSIAQFPKSVGK